MRGRMISKLIFSVACITVLLSINVSGYWDVTPITDNDTPDLGMRLDTTTGDLLWLDNNSNTLYYWDQSTITSIYTGFMSGYAINNQTVVYSYWDGSDYEVATWSSGTTTQRTNNSISDSYPVISGSLVGWMRNLGDWEIVIQNGGLDTQISDNSVPDQGLAINGTDLFWLATNPEARVWRYDGTNAFPVSASGDYACDSLIHDADDDHAVWIATYGSAGDDREIVYYDGSIAHRLTDNSVDDAFPELHENRVVWMGRGGTDGGMDYEIFLYDGGSITQLTENDYQDEYPDVSDTYVAWIQTDPVSPDQRFIMAYDGSTVTQVSSPAYSPDSVRIYNDILYLCLNDGTDKDIYQAQWIPDPTVTPTMTPEPTATITPTVTPMATSMPTLTPTSTPSSPPPVIPSSGPTGLIFLIVAMGFIIGISRHRFNSFRILFIITALISVASVLSPSVGFADWQSECIDCQPAFANLQSDGINIDAAGNTLLAAGFDHLYLLHENGAAWDMETIDTEPATGMFASLQMDSSGFAHISYFDDANNSLKYTRQTTTGWETSIIDATSNMGYFTSLRLDENEYPHIAYGNNSASNAGLYYAWFDGTSWHYETVQNEHVAFYVSLDFDASNESCIAFMDYYDRKLKYATRNAGNWTIESLVTEANCGYSACMVMDLSGLPHILHYCDGLLHTWHDGSDWQTETLTSVWIGSISMRVDSGNILHVTWIDDTALYYSTWDGSTWSTQTVVTETTDEALGWSALQLDSANYPRIAYGDNNSKELRYAEFNGSTWDLSYISRYESPGGYGSTVLDQNGFGHASYIERNFHILRYAWQDAQGWQHMDLDTESYVFYTDIALDANGNVHIGYYSTNPLAFKYTTNSSGDWITTTVATETGQYCHLAVDSADNVHAVFENTFLDGCQYGFFDGVAWTVEPITPLTGSIGGHLDICVSPDGTPHISFLNNADMNLGYGYRTLQGWQLQMNVDDHWWAGENTSIALNSQGYPYIAYNETQYDDNLRLARWNGSSWNIEVLMGDPSWSGSFASLVIDDQDYPHVACVSAHYNRFFYFFESSIGWHVSEGITCGEEPISLNLNSSNQPLIAYQDSQTWDYKFAGYTGSTPPTTTPTPPVTATPTTGATNTSTPTTPNTYTPTLTPTPTIDTPTQTPTLSNTYTPTHTPTQVVDTPTPTPEPTITQTPTPLPTSTPTNTGDCTDTGVEIIMPSQIFETNDVCWCHAKVCNMEATPLDGYPLFVILDVYGSLFWAPSFNTTFDNYLDLYGSFAPGMTSVEVLPEFPWPGGTGSANGIFWYGALTDPAITDLYGTFSSFEFGWQTN